MTGRRTSAAGAPDPPAPASGPTAAVELRPATMADADLLLRWANDAATRAASFHSAPIEPSGHVRWLAGRLASPTTRLWIGHAGGRPIGQVRLELGPDETAEVGISVAPEARGRGLGRRLLAAALERGRTELGTRRFVARVRPDNAASVALFRGAGFRRVGGPGLCAGQPCLELRRR